MSTGGISQHVSLMALARSRKELLEAESKLRPGGGHLWTGEITEALEPNLTGSFERT